MDFEEDEDLDEDDDDWIAEDDASHSLRISSHFCAPVLTNSSCLWDNDDEEDETNNSSPVVGGSGFLSSLSMSP